MSKLVELLDFVQAKAEAGRIEWENDAPVFWDLVQSLREGPDEEAYYYPPRKFEETTEYGQFVELAALRFSLICRTLNLSYQPPTTDPREYYPAKSHVEEVVRYSLEQGGRHSGLGLIRTIREVDDEVDSLELLISLGEFYPQPQPQSEDPDGLAP